ncbi:MAG TPA: type II toxin-antitoxin system HicA family toxin [Thermoplasmata archaeon]|nr:type II toxin-antitoxin system HicA family toxin [Thermoplasmata archaeon]
MRVLMRCGWSPARRRGSHVTLTRPGRRPLAVPLHHEVRKGLLRHLIREASLTVEEFVRILDEL